MLLHIVGHPPPQYIAAPSPRLSELFPVIVLLYMVALPRQIIPPLQFAEEFPEIKLLNIAAEVQYIPASAFPVIMLFEIAVRRRGH